MVNVIINKHQKLYVIPCGKNGYSCYGFDVLFKKVNNLCKALQVENTCKRKGTMKVYNLYAKLLHIAQNSGKRYNFDLYKPFIGHEGARVEILYTYGETERGILGKSTGFIPCHILLKQKRSNGGGAISNDSIKSFRFIDCNEEGKRC